MKWIPGFDDRDAVRTRRTFVVLGCPRGGTSLVAGALSAAGVAMGETDFERDRYEDQAFKIEPADSATAARRLIPVIQARNRAHEYWGWKLPNTIYYIDRIKHLLVEPTWLIVYRDPEAIARSSARHDGRDWAVEGERLLEAARRHRRLVEQFEASLRGAAQVFRLEEIHADPAAFVDRMLTIVAPLQPERERLLRFVDPHGGYHLHDGGTSTG